MLIATITPCSDLLCPRWFTLCDKSTQFINALATMYLINHFPIIELISYLSYLIIKSLAEPKTVGVAAWTQCSLNELWDLVITDYLISYVNGFVTYKATDFYTKNIPRLALKLAKILNDLPDWKTPKIAWKANLSLKSVLTLNLIQ